MAAKKTSDDSQDYLFRQQHRPQPSEIVTAVLKLCRPRDHAAFFSKGEGYMWMHALAAGALKYIGKRTGREIATELGLDYPYIKMVMARKWYRILPIWKEQWLHAVRESLRFMKEKHERQANNHIAYEAKRMLWLYFFIQTVSDWQWRHFALPTPQREVYEGKVVEQWPDWFRPGKDAMIILQDLPRDHYVFKLAKRTKLRPLDCLMMVLDTYECYPRHVGKQAAIKAIAAAMYRESLRFEKDGMRTWLWIRERASAYAASPHGTQNGMRLKFVPHPSTWFNQARFNDDEREWNIVTGDPKTDRGEGDIPEDAGWGAIDL